MPVKTKTRETFKIQKPRYRRMDEIPREYHGLTFNRMDAGESIFFARELEYIKAKTYDIKFPQLKARELLPVEFEANAGAESTLITSTRRSAWQRSLPIMLTTCQGPM